ncbi:MAG: SDR family NAD(P)-dependent oxidoreductase [Acetobacteraceae bacterium]
MAGELALAVLARGWNAAITARNPGDIADIVAAHPQTCLSLQLDVRDQSQIAKAVRETEARFGAIDALVNNAGYGYRAAVEEAAAQDIRDLFETNFFRTRLHHAGRLAWHAGSPDRPHHQHLVDRRANGPTWLRLLFRQ